MQICKCDRCGKEIDFANCVIYGYCEDSDKNRNDNGNFNYDLCPDCFNDIRDEINRSIACPNDNSGKWKSNDIFPEYTIDDSGLLRHHHGTKLISAKIKLKGSIITLIGSYWGVVFDPENKPYQRHYFLPYRVEQDKDPCTFVAKRNWNKIINWDDVIEWDYFDLV